MTKRLLCLAALFALVAALPGFAAWATEEAPVPPATEAAPAAVAPALEVAPSRCEPPAGVPPLTEPGKIPVLGCYAEWYCLHGGMVSCSLPGAGSCTSSGQGCGLVTCGGVTTWCPGHCVGDHHCYNFCGGAANPNSYCDYGCCVCQ